MLGLAGSVFTHGTIAAAIFLRLYLGGGHAGGAGENGHAGAGDTAIDVSLANPAENAPAPTQPAPAPTHVQEEAIEPLPPPPAKKQPAPNENTGHDESTNGGKLAGPTILASPMPGAGSDSVEGQRALLPHAAVCKDPVAGKWEALKFSPAHGDWVHFTLSVRRSGGTLVGTILSHTWAGGVFDRTPPACTSGGFDITVSMTAIGRADGTRIRFGSSTESYSVVAVACVQLGHDYAPDHFRGVIDPARQEFQSVNNDGANDIDAPYVFRRTGCLD